MSSHELTTTITIGSSESPATVEFDFHPAIKGYVPRGEAFALEPDEPPSVTVERITIHAKDPKRSVVLVEGLLFDLCCDEWLIEQCLDYVSEDA
jgi:hypothetical protein